MKKQVSVAGVSRNGDGNFRVLILKEVAGERTLPLVIGQAEAQAIVVALEALKLPRPLIYDMFANTFEVFDITLKEVFIYNKKDGVYFTNIICEQQEKIVEIDFRPSDAIALALRANAPIFLEEEILENYGVNIKDKVVFLKHEMSLFDMDRTQLEALQEECVKAEDYEKAAAIRDVLKTKI
ncbi:MAG: bifunctional nuclease family protein [Paludibacteraceae bacterium]|nr:bifunctional nuclease family protein [Paludibacteraceae bacterium]